MDRLKLKIHNSLPFTDTELLLAVSYYVLSFFKSKKLIRANCFVQMNKSIMSATRLDYYHAISK